MNISTLDLIITAIYLVGITAIGVFTGYKKKTTSEEYFLAGKSLGWFSIGSAMFASNISTIHLVGRHGNPDHRLDRPAGSGTFEICASVSALFIPSLIFIIK